MYIFNNNSKSPKAGLVSHVRLFRGVRKWSNQIVPPLRIVSAIIQILIGLSSLTGVASDLSGKHTPNDTPNCSDVSAVCTHDTNANMEANNY